MENAGKKEWSSGWSGYSSEWKAILLHKERTWLKGRQCDRRHIDGLSDRLQVLHLIFTRTTLATLPSTINDTSISLRPMSVRGTPTFT